MAILTLQFDASNPVPDPPSDGHKLFLGADGLFRTIAADGTLNELSGGVSDWADIQNKPSTFPPDPHTHPSTDISDFVQAANDAITVIDAGTF